MERLPGQPSNGVVELAKKMSTSVALSGGAFGNQFTPASFELTISLVTLFAKSGLAASKRCNASTVSGFNGGFDVHECPPRSGVTV